MRYEKGTFAIVPNIHKLRELSLGARAVYTEICVFADGYGRCFPSQTTLADNLDVNVRSVKRFIAELVEKGFIEKVERHRIDGSQTSNQYQLLSLPQDTGVTPGEDTSVTPLTISNITISTSGETEVSRVEDSYSIVVEEDTPTKKPPAFDPKPVYAVFHAVLGVETFPWTANRTERLSAQNLLKRGSLAKIRSAVEFAKEHEDHEHCPLILKPSDLDRKWDNLKVFKEKNG